jgi:hypothetical protein
LNAGSIAAKACGRTHARQSKSKNHALHASNVAVFCGGRSQV